MPFRRTGLVAVFLLGVIMWTPSLAYLAALELIAAADLGLAREAVNLDPAGVAAYGVGTRRAHRGSWSARTNAGATPPRGCGPGR